MCAFNNLIVYLLCETIAAESYLISSLKKELNTVWHDGLSGSVDFIVCCEALK